MEEPQIDPVTTEGRTRLEAELKHLTTVGRAKIAERMRRAREESPGEWGDSTAVLDARRESSILEARIAQLKAALDLAEMRPTPAAEAGVVHLGSRVTVRDEEGTIATFMLVDPVEADPTLGFVSIAAPVGQVLLGGRIGNTVVATTPAGPRSLAILQVEEAVAPDEPGW